MTASNDPPVVLGGRSNPELTREIAAGLGRPVCHCELGHFEDAETYVQIDENIRGRDVFIVQSTSAPVNEHLMELLIMIDAAKRASARRITAVLPYYGYARQDRKHRPRVPITAKLVANLLTTAGAQRILTIDLHAGQIQGFFDIPVDHLYGSKVLLSAVQQWNLQNPVVVAPDVGSVKRGRAFANHLGCPLAIVDKRRPRANQAEVMNIIGEVAGRDAVLVDDMIDTAGTITKAAAAIKKAGAPRVYACATHAVFSGDALGKIGGSPLAGIVVTNTVPFTQACDGAEIRVVSVGGLLAEAIVRIHSETSVSDLFLPTDLEVD